MSFAWNGGEQENPHLWSPLGLIITPENNVLSFVHATSYPYSRPPLRRRRRREKREAFIFGADLGSFFPPLLSLFARMHLARSFERQQRTSELA